MALFSEGGGTFPDILIVVCLLTCCVISSIINPVVFVYNSRQLTSVPQFLFRILATIDFLTCLALPIAVSINVLEPRVTECKAVGNTTECIPHYLEEHGNVTTAEQLQGIITWTLLITPPIITALLATSRFLQIRHPLRPIRLRYIVVFLFLYLVYVVVALSCLFFQPNTRYYARIQSVWNIFPGLDILETVLAFTGPCIVCQVISLFFSVLTVWELFKSIREPTAVQLRKNGWKCSVKILITNFGSILFMTFYLAMLTVASTPVKYRSKTDCILYLLYSVAVPVLLSVFNPVVFVVFTPRTFKVAWQKLSASPSIPTREQSVDYLNYHAKEQTQKETQGSKSKVYKIGETSTVVQVKPISEVELQSMVYSNFHTIRKETENALERVQSPIVFDLSEGGDRQRRVSRFRSMEQCDGLISPVSWAEDSNSVFSRSASVNVARRDTKSGRGTRNRTESNVTTKSFPNVTVSKKAESAIDVVAENETDNVDISNAGKKNAAIDETKLKSEAVNADATKFKAKIVKRLSGLAAAQEMEMSLDTDKTTETGETTKLKRKEAKGTKLSTVKREVVLSNSDNMCVDSENETEWDIEKGAEFSSLHCKVRNTNDKPLNSSSP